MSFVLQTWQLLHLILAGWVNRQQQQVIEYLRTENQILREKLGKRRILLNDDHRRRLAVKGKVLGRQLLHQVATIVAPDTILRWHLMLVGVETVKFARDLRFNRHLVPVVATLAGSLLANMAVGFAIGLAVHYLLLGKDHRHKHVQR